MKMPNALAIKTIETNYNGFRFRSRLEARWAVFFDHLGIKYEYEPEGFKLKSGKQYLPDFRLKGKYGDIWFEVQGPEPTKQERLTAAEFSVEKGEPIALARGNHEVDARGWPKPQIEHGESGARK
jgi:hypothetical protein